AAVGAASVAADLEPIPFRIQVSEIARREPVDLAPVGSTLEGAEDRLDIAEEVLVRQRCPLVHRDRHGLPPIGRAERNVVRGYAPVLDRPGDVGVALLHEAPNLNEAIRAK